jgi:hypothetical protein
LKQNRLLSSLRLPALLLQVTTVAALGCQKSPPSPAVSGKLTVLIRPPDRKLEPVPVDAPGALPARTGGAMYLEAQLEKPAFVYLIWIDAAGKVKPLYPWNNEKIEVTDFDHPPPVRRATNRVFSPMLGHDWTLDGPPGLETVLLLARETALPENVKLSELLADLGPPPVPTSPDELTTIQITSDKAIETTHRPVAGNGSTGADWIESIEPTLQRLAQHFALVRAVRFAHEDPK